MKGYILPNEKLWTGRSSEQKLYLHEAVNFIDLNSNRQYDHEKAFGLIAYACDEGVRRNLGRPGAATAPDIIKAQLGKLTNHLPEPFSLLDLGSISCIDGDMEAAQEHLGTAVGDLLENNIFPIVLGGGHDIAYGHYGGIKNHLKESETLGIINFDAHFDLRDNKSGNNSGTPFFQIAEDCKWEQRPFHYQCLGIRKEANDKGLFSTAKKFGVKYTEVDEFTIHNLEQVREELTSFMDKVDRIYVTIDLDGFSSAYAPGVSASSPMGFSPDIVLETLKTIISSEKLISIDVAELNPQFDIDHQTAKLAASLVHFVMHKVALL
ncbi:MAG: formimidoylglutamase [Flavobacteriaceae bacterium]